MIITEEFNYTNEFHESVEYDKFYCFLLNRIVDLGWKETVPDAHRWISVLNRINGNLFSNHNIITKCIQMNLHTFDSIYLESYVYYRNNKIGSYSVEVNETIEDNLIQLKSDKDIVGQIIIKNVDNRE